MNRWEKTLISPETSIRQALKVVDESRLQVALVVDANRRLLGTLTDGDVRRAILSGADLDGPVSGVMFTSFTAATMDESRESILRCMRAKEIRQIPVLDGEGRVVDLRLLLDMVEQPRRENQVVLMAGGLGSRLQPLTDDCPKPLLKVGGRPILETIMLGFMEHGFHNFHLSVNYKAEMVEAHFGDGSRWGANIRYLRETTKLGTAGCLSLLPERPERTFFVMNGDLLTRVNFERMLAFHHENRSMATMGIREHEFEVPYGVVEMKNHRLLGLKEKPVQRFFVNAGVYAFEPETLDCIGSGEPLDMPEFFERIMARDLEASVFPIHEYWLDIGRHGDYDRANGDFLRHFED